MFGLVWFWEDVDHPSEGEMALVRMTPRGEPTVMCASNWENYVFNMNKAGRWVQPL